MIPGISIEMASKAKIPTTPQTTPSRPNNAPTIACRAINPSPLDCLLLTRSTDEDLVPSSSPEHRNLDGPRRQEYRIRARQGTGGLHTGGLGTVLRGVRPVAAGPRPSFPPLAP